MTNTWKVLTECSLNEFMNSWTSNKGTALLGTTTLGVFRPWSIRFCLPLTLSQTLTVCSIICPPHTKATGGQCFCVSDRKSLGMQCLFPCYSYHSSIAYSKHLCNSHWMPGTGLGTLHILKKKFIAVQWRRVVCICRYLTLWETLWLKVMSNLCKIQEHAYDLTQGKHSFDMHCDKLNILGYIQEIWFYYVSSLST